jgi:hypothetical protein
MPHHRVRHSWALGKEKGQKSGMGEREGERERGGERERERERERDTATFTYYIHSQGTRDMTIVPGERTLLSSSGSRVQLEGLHQIR